MSSPIYFFLIIMIIILSPPATASEAGGIFDIMDETFYTGNWSGVESEYNAPPSNGCFMTGRMFVITHVSTRFKEGDWKSHIYAEEYRTGVMKDRGHFGDAISRTRGGFVDGISGACFFVKESVYNRQDNDTKTRIDQECNAVVPNSWHPFHGHPNDPYDVKIQNQGYLWGYVHIVLDNLSRLNTTYYIPSSDAFHIDAKSWNDLASDRNKRDGWDVEVQGTEEKMTHSISEGVVTAELDVVVKWCYRSKKRNLEGEFRYNNKTSTAAFHSYAVMPQVLNSTQATAIIMSHNNSVMPHSLIDVRINETVTATEICYRNQVATHHNKVGVLTNEDGLEYFDFVDADVWVPDPDGMIVRRGGYYVIDEAPLDTDNLTITVSTPYESFEVVEYNVTVMHSKPTDHVQWQLMIWFLSLLGVLLLVPYIMLRRIGRL